MQLQFMIRSYKVMSSAFFSGILLASIFLTTDIASAQNESTGVQKPHCPIIAINMQDTSGGGGWGMVSPTALSKIMWQLLNACMLCSNFNE